jgi:addiction module HigA family antidote
MRKANLKGAAGGGPIKPMRSARSAPPMSGHADAGSRFEVEGVGHGDLATLASDAIDALREGAPLPPVHPGEVLLEEFIRPHGLTPIRAAKRLNVPRTRIERLVAGVTPVTEDTALRLERLFGASAEFWLNLQASHDLAVARARRPADIEAITPLS